MFVGIGAVAAYVAAQPAIAAVSDDCHIDHRRLDGTVMLTVCVGWTRAAEGLVYSRALSYTDLDIEDLGEDVVVADVERQIRESITGDDRETFVQHPRNQIFSEPWSYGASRADDAAYKRRLQCESAKINERKPLTSEQLAALLKG